MIKKFIQHILIISLILYPVFWLTEQIDALNPLKKVFKDITFSDYYFNSNKENRIKSDTIIIVDIGYEHKEITRFKIQKLLKKINHNKYKPKVIGLDMMFKKHSKNLETDSLLALELKSDNIILMMEIHSRNDKNFIKENLDYFRNSNPVGFTNAWNEGDQHTVRYFKQKFNFKYGNIDTIYNHFAIEIARKFDESSIKYLREKMPSDDNYSIINYSYNFYNSRCSIDSAINILSDSIFEGKIVLIGLNTHENNEPVYAEDLWHSPLNNTPLGKSKPDIYGIEIIGNIISSIIKKDLIQYNYCRDTAIQVSLGLLFYFVLLFILTKYNNQFIVLRFLLQILLISVCIYLSVKQIGITDHKGNYFDFTLLTIIGFFGAEILYFTEKINNKLENIYNKLFSKD